MPETIRPTLMHAGALVRCDERRCRYAVASLIGGAFDLVVMSEGAGMRSLRSSTVNFLLDARTAEATADGDPLDYRHVISRTDRGHRVDPNAIIGVSLWALIRRVVTSTPSVVIELGRTSRLFTGHARDAVMLLEPECIWPGCDQPHTWCHADHLTAWSTRGPTNPDNGAPLCARHNYLKTLGFTISRDDDGHWHITTPDGTQIC